MPLVFVVDDDEETLDSLRIFFNRRNYEVSVFADTKTLLQEVTDRKPELIMLDINLQGEDGRNLCQLIKETVKYPVKILLASADPMALLSYQYSYADGIINKPFHLNDLEVKCKKLLSTGKW